MSDTLFFFLLVVIALVAIYVFTDEGDPWTAEDAVDEAWESTNDKRYGR